MTLKLVGFVIPGRGAEEADMILSAMNTYGSRVNYFNPWIPGMTASIQRRVVEAQEKRKMNASFHNVSSAWPFLTWTP